MVNFKIIFYICIVERQKVVRLRGIELRAADYLSLFPTFHKSLQFIQVNFQELRNLIKIHHSAFVDF